MHPIIKAQTQEFAGDNQLAHLKDHERFETYCIYSIVNGAFSESANPLDVWLEGDEFGIDGIGSFIGSELYTTTDGLKEALDQSNDPKITFYFIQAKNSSSLDYGDMSKFFDATIAFFEGNNLASSPAMTDAAGVKDGIYNKVLKSNPRIRLVYAYTGSGEMAEPIKKLRDATRSRLDAMSLFSEVDLVIAGVRDLQEGYRSATSSVMGSITITNPITLPGHPNVSQAFLGYVSGSELLQLVEFDVPGSEEKKINPAIFFDNVRDYDENSEINKGIISQLRSGDGGSFIFKNNGVTVVAKEMNRTGDRFMLTDFQVVNGCQTSNILHYAREYVENVHIPFRLIVSGSEDFVSGVIVGTNKQNQVRDEQFIALSRLMKDLEEYSRSQDGELRLYVERRENQYRAGGIERTRIVRTRDIIKSLAAILLFRPHRAARDYRSIRDEFSSSLFQDGHSVSLYHAAAYANYRLDFLSRNNRIPKQDGIYKYFVLETLGRAAGITDNTIEVAVTKQDKIATRILEMLTDEDKLVDRFKHVSEVLTGIEQVRTAGNREQLRDTLRSESVARSFSQRWLDVAPDAVGN